jgi:glycerophosphoryl diester phosphodiesterase
MNKCIVLLLVLFACKPIPQTNNTMATVAFDYQGHRGCRGLMPENTIPAMLKAIDLGVTTLETDAIITKDNQVILSHEPFFNHEITTKPNGEFVTEAEEKSLNMYQMTYEEVKRFDVGLKPHPRFQNQTKLAVAKPLLSDMIDAAERYARAKHKAPVHYNIETKTQAATDNQYHPSPAAFVELLVAVIQSKKITERVTIQSFDIRTLQYLHQKYPLIKTALLIEDFDKSSFSEQITQLGFVPTIYSPHFSLVNTELIQTCHSKGIQIIPWTVNDLATIQQLKNMGVNGIISDFPNLFNQ